MRNEAELALAHLKNDQKDIDDSVEDLKKALTGDGLMTRKDGIRVVDAPEAAYMIVEVMGRRSERKPGEPGPIWRDNAYYLYLRLSAGPKADAARFQSIPHEWGGSAREIRGPAVGASFWAIEIYGGVRWLMAADHAASAINNFAKSHYDMLKGRPTTSTP